MSSSRSNSEGCLAIKFSAMHILTVALISFFVGSIFPALRSRPNDPAPLDDASAEIAARACNETMESELLSSSYASGASPWCPEAKCHNTDLCEPCKRRYLIILATGRSASTTLMNMMGQLPNVRMSGENNDLLGHLKRLEDDVLEYPRFQDNHKNGAWKHNPLLNGSLACVSQQMIETINPPMVDREGHFLIQDEATKILGFKTIRLLSNVKEKEDDAVAAWLIKTMPCARFLINIRSDVEDQASSRSEHFQNGKSAEALRDMNRRMRNLQKKLGPHRARMTDGSRFTKHVSVLNNALAWLGYSEECNFTKVLEFNTHGDGYENGDVDTSDLMVDASSCRHLGEEQWEGGELNN